MDDPRLTDLEIRYTHLERQLAELSQVVFEQQKTIETLRRKLHDVHTRVGEWGDPTPNDPPPHY